MERPSPRDLLAHTAAGCIAVALVLAIQFPGFWSFEQIPAEADITTIELAARAWVFDGPGRIFGIQPLGNLGSPVTALPIAGLTFPTTWLAALLPWNVAFIVAWFIQASLFVVGWTQALRALGFPVVAAVSAPLLLVATGPVWSFHAVGGMDLASISLTGWVTWALAAWRAAPSAARAALVGLLLALVYTAGDPLMVPLSALVALLACWPLRQPLRTTTLGVLVALLTAAGLVWPLLVEAAAFYPLSERSPPLPLSLFERLGFSTPPARLLELVSSAFRLDPEEVRRINAGAMNADEFWYPSLTLGCTVLALFALGARRALRQEPASALLGAVVVGLGGLTLGRWSEACTWAWDALPPLTHIRFPERLWRHALLCALPLVAIGLRDIVARVGDRRWVPWSVATMGLTELLAQTPQPLMMPLPVTPPEFAALQGPARAHAVRVTVDRRLDLARPAIRFDTRFHGIPMSQVADSSMSPILKFVPPEYWPDHAALQWLGVSHLLMPATPGVEGSVDRLLQLGQSVPLGDTGYVMRTVQDSSPQHGLLLHRTRPGRPFDHHTAGAPSADTPDGAVPLGPPTVDMEGFLKGLARGEFLVDDRYHLEGGMLVEGGAVPAPPSSCAERAADPVQLEVSNDVSIIRAHVTDACGGVLSVPWRFLQGWEARVDTRPVPIVAVNAVTMGVALGPGSHAVELRWRSPGSRYVWVTWTTMAGVFTLVGVRIRRRARVAPHAMS